MAAAGNGMECRRRRRRVGLVLLVAGALATAAAAKEDDRKEQRRLSRSSFPPGFVFGAAGASYQYEGAWNGSGKEASIWDTFTHTYPEKIVDRSNGDVALDSYHRYKEDVSLLKDMNMDAYRFSISWTRILPNGSLSGGINKEGIRYYNDLIDEIVSKGLKPFATLFHWDSPQGLEDLYKGWLGPQIVVDYKDYADVCFGEFGDRVKHWITLNEPWTFVYTGYNLGAFAPGRCSPLEFGRCPVGDSGTEPYIISHHLLLAHAAAVKLYRDKYQASHEGVIGITLVSFWFLPYFNSQADRNATQRALDFMFGWYLDPLVYGNYPESMRMLVGSRLPEFTEEEIKTVKKSFDFIGINYYSAFYATNSPRRCLTNAANATSYGTDSQVYMTGIRNGKLIGKKSASYDTYVYPKGIRDLLVYTKDKYSNPVIYITENGFSELNNASLPLEEALKDFERVVFYNQHLEYVRIAIREGVDVRGFFAWSLLDNFEWVSGYTIRYGINFVDYNNGLKRHPKASHYWFKDLLLRN